jgi:hypothetical protein
MWSVNAKETPSEQVCYLLHQFCKRSSDEGRPKECLWINEQINRIWDESH